MKPIIIIGSGLAAYSLAREFRRLDKQTALTIICADSGNNYSKPMLSNAFAKSKTAETLVMASAESMQQSLAATIINHTKVVSINTQSKSISTINEQYDYAQLVLATGAQPIRPPLQGSAAEQVLAVNSLQDYAIFRQAIIGKKNIAILGPGLIGCEFANDLLQGNFNVCVIGPDKTPMQQLLPQAAGEHLQQSLSAIGVQWQLNTLVKSIDHSPSSDSHSGHNNISLTLENGSCVQADVVLSAIGLHANSQLAQDAGMNTKRGIVVDKSLRTSVENVYALGDCAEVNGYFLPFVMPIMHCARVLAATLAAAVDNTTPIKPLCYPPMPIIIKTPACPVVLASPDNPNQGSWSIDHNSAGVKALHHTKNAADAEQLTGFVLTGTRINEKQELLKQLAVLF